MMRTKLIYHPEYSDPFRPWIMHPPSVHIYIHTKNGLRPFAEANIDRKHTPTRYYIKGPIPCTVDGIEALRKYVSTYARHLSKTM